MTAFTSHPRTDFAKSEYILYVTNKKSLHSVMLRLPVIKGIFPSVGNGQNAYICGISILGVISMTSSFSSDAKAIWATC